MVFGLHGLFLRLGLTGSIPGVILAHLIPVLPYMTLIMAAVFARFDPRFEAQARSLGATPFQTFRTVTLPAILPGLLIAGLFAFLVSWSQYLLTFAIGGGRVQTLPLLLFSFASAGRNDITAALNTDDASGTLSRTVLRHAGLIEFRAPRPRVRALQWELEAEFTE